MVLCNNPKHKQRQG
nr:ribosomal protein L36 [Klebsormidium nitens]